MNELDRLVPDVEPITLSTGFTVELVRMKTRQFFRLLKVLTHGAGPRLIQEGLDFGADMGAFAAKLAALVALSIPDAESETIEFIKSMCQPAGLVGGINGKQQSEMNKQETEVDAALWARFHTELFNPDPLDMFELVEKIVRREASDLQALGKKIASLMELAAKTGQDQPGEPEPAPEAQDLQLPDPNPSPASSPAPSTSYPTNTAGPTGNFSTYPYADSGSAPMPPQNVVAPRQ